MFMVFKFSTATQPEQRRNYFQFIGNAYGVEYADCHVYATLWQSIQFFFALTANVSKVNTFSISSISFITRVTSQLNIPKSWRRLREMPPRTDLPYAILCAFSYSIIRHRSRLGEVKRRAKKQPTRKATNDLDKQGVGVIKSLCVFLFGEKNRKKQRMHSWNQIDVSSKSADDICFWWMCDEITAVHVGTRTRRLISRYNDVMQPRWKPSDNEL